MTNLKLVLRTYSALRQMSPDDIALLETLRALNDGDRELMVETLQGKATTRKAGKKSSKSSPSKSPRASGIHAQLKSRVSEQREAATITNDAVDDNERCGFKFTDNGVPCGQSGDANIHHLKSELSYHPFVSTAPPAPASSSANGGVGSTTANSETQPEDVGTVAHGASGGD